MKRTALNLDKNKITEELVVLENERSSDYMAHFYDNEHGYIRKNYLYHIIIEEIRYIFSEINKPNISVLDLGCGTGYFSMICAEMGAKVHAVDISEKMLEILQRKIDSTRSVASKINISKKEFKDFFQETQERYDLIIFGSVLHHIKDYKKTLSKSIDLLEKGGYLYIVNEPIGKHSFFDYPDMLINKLFFNPKDIIKAIFRKFFRVEIDHELYNRLVCDYHIFMEGGLNLEEILEIFNIKKLSIVKLEKYTMSNLFLFYWLTQKFFKSSQNAVRIIAKY